MKDFSNGKVKSIDTSGEKKNRFMEGEAVIHYYHGEGIFVRYDWETQDMLSTTGYIKFNQTPVDLPPHHTERDKTFVDLKLIKRKTY